MAGCTSLESRGTCWGVQAGQTKPQRGMQCRARGCKQLRASMRPGRSIYCGRVFSRWSRRGEAAGASCDVKVSRRPRRQVHSARADSSSPFQTVVTASAVGRLVNQGTAQASKMRPKCAQDAHSGFTEGQRVEGQGTSDSAPAVVCLRQQHRGSNHRFHSSEATSTPARLAGSVGSRGLRCAGGDCCWPFVRRQGNCQLAQVGHRVFTVRCPGCAAM